MCLCVLIIMSLQNYPWDLYAHWQEEPVNKNGIIICSTYHCNPFLCSLLGKCMYKMVLYQCILNHVHKDCGHMGPVLQPDIQPFIVSLFNYKFLVNFLFELYPERQKRYQFCISITHYFKRQNLLCPNSCEIL